MKANFYKNASDIWPMLNEQRYDFLTDLDRTNTMLFVTLSGSRGYGTCYDFNTADYDFRGVMGHTRKQIFGLFDEEDQHVEFNKEADVDTTIYTLKKLVKLLVKCNPNTIELLGCKDYLIYHPIALKLILSQKLFLSQLAIGSFGGYATAQFDRLENNLARFTLDQRRKEEHILHSVLSAADTFSERYTKTDNQKIKLFTDESDKTDLESEIFLDLDFKHYPLRDFAGMINEMTSILRNYNKVNHRNKKKDDEHLNKHAMHLIRLYYTLYDILTKEEVITYREAERDELLSIRRGDFQKSDGTYREEFFELLEDAKKKCNEAAKNTSLPERPNLDMIEELVMEMTETMIKDK